MSEEGERVQLTEDDVANVVPLRENLQLLKQAVESGEDIAEPDYAKALAYGLLADLPDDGAISLKGFYAHVAEVSEDLLNSELGESVSDEVAEDYAGKLIGLFVNHKIAN